MDHIRHMRHALSLASARLGQTWPNPSVGAVVVQNGQVIARAATAKGGRPHAEPQALKAAGERAKGATLYVTLEPCSHHGQTPPCTDAIIAAGIKTVVIGARDPHISVNGEGIEKLKAAGIEVIENVCQKEAFEINRGFFSVVQRKRPYVALKIATSADGKITTGTEERWITSERARAYGHLLRSQFDAIATGIGTVLADDPLLTVRLPGLENHSPVRVLFDRKNRFPASSQMAQSATKVPVWPTDKPIPEALEWLAGKGITRLMIEAGSQLSSAFLASGQVDRIYWFRAPAVIGNKGQPAFEAGLPSRFTLIQTLSLAPDQLEMYECSLAS